MAKRGRPATRKPASGNLDIASGVEQHEGTASGGNEQIDGVDSIDPSALGDTGTGSAGNDNNGDDNRPEQREPRARRGRPKGSRKSAPLDLTDLKDIVVMAHSAAAIALSAPRLTIDEMEGEKLASAVQKVLRHYDLPDVASETKDWIGLMLVAGSVYGPRLASYWADKNTPPPPPSPQEADNMVAFNPAMRTQ